ncbi:hypothetical protein OKW21_002235 [Catalinimonas alkaloidigena]|nr:hypothetical protein [Catalinimonas alkaloidigena]
MIIDIPKRTHLNINCTNEDSYHLKNTFYYAHLQRLTALARHLGKN